MRVIPDKVYYAPKRVITLKKETTDATWNLSETMEVNFTVSGPIYAYNITAPFELELRANFSRPQETKVRYELVCNGKLNRVLAMDIADTRSTEIIGSYPDTLERLANSLLKSGDNQFKLRISVVSTCDEASWSYFQLTIKDLRVQNHVLDLDQDGIWDNVDLVPMNNYVCTALLAALTTPIVAGLALRSRRLKSITHHR